MQKYGRTFSIFHFSGHADKDRLKLEDITSYVEGFAKRLKEELTHSHRMVCCFLNGCCTEYHQHALLSAGVPIVIGTHYPVDDKIASEFSQKFYEHFLFERTSIMEAFEAAKNYLYQYQPGIQIYRGMKPAKEDNMPCWGIFYQPEHEPFIHWNLDYRPSLRSRMPNDHEINEYLMRQLYRKLLNLGIKGVKEIHNRVLEGDDEDIEQLNTAITQAFPTMIENELRRLLAPSRYVRSEERLFDTISQERLYQIMEIYQVFNELMFFIILSQLWESCEREDNELVLPIDRKASSSNLDLIQKFFHTKRKDRKYTDFIPLIRAVRQIIDQVSVPYFIHELQNLVSLVNTENNFSAAYRFFRDLQEKLAQRTINLSDAQQVEYWCKESEVHLAHYLSDLAFCAQYDLITVKVIELIMYRHMDMPIFDHNYYKNANSRNKGRRQWADYTCSKSVLLVNLANSPNNKGTKEVIEDDKKRKVNSVLSLSFFDHINLSPFILDMNAFGEETKENLLIFSHYDSSGTFHYQLAFDPSRIVSFAPGNELYDTINCSLKPFLGLFLDA
ncbi:hypothetical protein CRP01_34435 [Flavilitoribacter nigricans DSM 23189 = NBRC 102662]|uniref:CHAT domain-containing protein n=1 Tax=Flavilitoribacter nigricans (strain ATCC 23147 / DSM 23189 / NBRC 102662 / NCIMB 1420 / SS-2) TaxID=1122177 RepID=A0A2D0N0W3_FLAN2|nr:hypothetical protein CRP01_34435 [Flavilitoribacter nigricans DSM 23189 = NBRC 102662]